MYRCSHCTHDNDCMHTTIDGADQTAFGLPHFNQDDKCMSEGLKYKVGISLGNAWPEYFVCMHFIGNHCTVSCMQTKLYGAITHGVCTIAFIFSGYMPGGTFVTIEVLDR